MKDSVHVVNERNEWYLGLQNCGFWVTTQVDGTHRMAASVSPSSPPFSDLVNHWLSGVTLRLEPT